MPIVKKLFPIFLAISFLFVLLPFVVFADDDLRALRDCVEGPGCTGWVGPQYRGDRYNCIKTCGNRYASLKKDDCEIQCTKMHINTLDNDDPWDACVANCLESPIGTKADIGGVIHDIASWLYGIVGTIATLMLIIGGIMYMTAAGDEDRAGKAKKLMMYAIIGIIIALIAWGAESVIRDFLGD